MPRILRLAAAALIAAAAAAGPAAAGRPRAVVELFTSQGCSSCPPADALLAELARDEEIVALSLPVQLWDHLGWRDTLGTPDNTARQQAYAHGRRDRQVYTPQAVVNGVAHVVGSSREAIEGKAARGGGLPVDVDCEQRDGRLAVRIAAWREGAAPAARIVVLRYDREHVVDIPAGENGGRRVAYRNVVRRIEPLGAWSGAERTLTIAAPGPGEGLALLVQADAADGHPGRVLGAVRAD